MHLVSSTVQLGIMRVVVVVLLTLGRSVSPCPSSCACNEEGAVECTGDITDIPQPMSLHTYLLILKRTNMAVLRDLVLQPLTLLLRLSITDSLLDTIEPEAFSVAPQLLSIKLSGNRLSSFPPGVFRNLPNLEQLHLDGNQIASVPPELFEGLGNITELDLAKNSISHLQSNAFQNLHRLRFLNLGKNLLTQLPPSLFHSLPYLQFLILYNNQLESLHPGAFDHLDNLLELKLHNNAIRSIPPQLFWNLPYLQTLTLSSNQLRTLPEETLYHLPHMEKLTLYKNPLESLPERLVGHMPELKEQFLYDTSLTTVPWNLFANMTGLLTLNLNLNEHLSVLPENLFCCNPSLTRLSLRSNQLQSLHPQLFSHLPNLKVLQLKKNRLPFLPDTIFHDLRNIEEIELQGNEFQTLPGNVFATSVSTLKSVALIDNPWNCSCSIMPFATWIRNNSDLVKDTEKVICQEPLHLRNVTLGSLTYPMCQPTTTTTAMTTTTATTMTTAMTTIADQKTDASTNITSAFAQWTTPAKAQPVSLETTTSAYLTTAPGAPSTSTLPDTTAPVTSPVRHAHTTTEEPALPTTTVDNHYAALHPILVVLESGPDIVHNNQHGGWVYLWTVPPSGAYGDFLMTIYVITLVMGVALLMVGVYKFYRLSQAMRSLAVLTGCKAVRAGKRKEQIL